MPHSRLPGFVLPILLLGLVVVPATRVSADEARPDTTVAAALEGPRVIIATFNFGGAGTSSDRHFAFGAGMRDTRYGWYGGMLVNRLRRGVADRLLRDFVEGEDATFGVGIEPADAEYHVVLTIGDMEAERGAIDVLVGGKMVLEGVRAPAGKMIRVEFDARPENGCLSFRIRGEKCRSFALAAAQIFGPAGAHVVDLFPAPDARPFIPRPDSLAGVESVDPRELLRRTVDYLLANQLSDGGFSYHGAWYQNSFPVRTLLAGSVLLSEPAWRDRALEILDRFVAGQMQDGNWMSSYYGSPGCELSSHTDKSSANLADIGSMSLCLSMAAPLADPVRRQRYIEAAMFYADSIVVPSQLPTGAFPNRLWGGQVLLHPYSIATATQASNLVLLYSVTGEIRYRDAAEKAALWLARTVRPEGGVELFQHNTAEIRVMNSTDFGDIYYIMEALSITGHYSADSAVREAIRAGLERWLYGREGLAATAVHGYWWPMRENDFWGASKMAGVPFLLARYGGHAPDPALAKWLRLTLAWIGDSGLAFRAGVRAHPGGPNGEFALAATGFSGIGLAAAIDPDVLLPPPGDLRRSSSGGDPAE